MESSIHYIKFINKKITLKLLHFSATLKHVAKTVAHVDLNDHMINVIFTIFDENRELIHFIGQFS